MNSDQEVWRIEALERLLSVQRLSRYTGLANGDRQAALRHYERNTRLSEALYTPLQGLEVCLRNALCLELTSHLGPEWYENLHGVFQHPLTEMIANAKKCLSQDGKAVELNRMVAELNFGFWVTVLSPRYDTELWRAALRKAFPKRPRRTERKDIHKALNALRRLRNRVAHHEPIVHRNLKHDHELIVEVVSWVCPETSTWITSQSRFMAELSAA